MDTWYVDKEFLRATDIDENIVMLFTNIPHKNLKNKYNACVTTDEQISNYQTCTPIEQKKNGNIQNIKQNSIEEKSSQIYNNKINAKTLIDKNQKDEKNFEQKITKTQLVNKVVEQSDSETNIKVDKEIPKIDLTAFNILRQDDKHKKKDMPFTSSNASASKIQFLEKNDTNLDSVKQNLKQAIVDIVNNTGIGEISTEKNSYFCESAIQSKFDICISKNKQSSKQLHYFSLQELVNKPNLRQELLHTIFTNKIT